MASPLILYFALIVATVAHSVNANPCGCHYTTNEEEILKGIDADKNYLAIGLEGEYIGMNEKVDIF